MTDAVVRLAGVRKELGKGEVVALEGIDLEIQPGEFVSLIGPSGCGKSTLLRIVGDLIQPTSGDVVVNGKPARRARVDRDYGIVFQDAVLFDWRTVEKNISLPLELTGWSRARRADSTLDTLTAAAQAMAGGRSDQIAMLVNGIHDDYFSPIASGVLRAAEAADPLGHVRPQLELDERRAAAVGVGERRDHAVEPDREGAHARVDLAMRADAQGNRPKASELLEEASRREPKTAIPAALLSSFSDAAGNAALAKKWEAEALSRLRGASPYESLLVRYLVVTGDRARDLALARSAL